MATGCDSAHCYPRLFPSWQCPRGSTYCKAAWDVCGGTWTIHWVEAPSPSSALRLRPCHASWRTDIEAGTVHVQVRPRPESCQDSRRAPHIPCQFLRVWGHRNNPTSPTANEGRAPPLNRMEEARAEGWTGGRTPSSASQGPCWRFSHQAFHPLGWT